MIQCIGEKRLRGFQIGIYLLGLVTIILGGIGFGIWGTHISWKIGSVPIKWILLAAALNHFWRHGILRPQSAWEKLP